MKKSLKITLIVLGILLGIIILDTLQAKVFDNSPIIKLRETYYGGEIYYIDKGLLVNHYHCNNNEKVTTWKGTKFTCPICDENCVTDTDDKQQSNDKFSLVFYQKTSIKPKQKELIIRKNEIKGVDYNVYAFEGHVAINLNSDRSELTKNSLSLRDALLKNKITMKKILDKANEDLNKNIIKGDIYKDGGSVIYKYGNYTIIKCNTLDGNRDVYIGSKDMGINDLDL